MILMFFLYRYLVLHFETSSLSCQGAHKMPLDNLRVLDTLRSVRLWSHKVFLPSKGIPAPVSLQQCC